jgi:hypothetical protein
MPTRIIIPQRIVPGIGIPIQRLRIPRLRHHRIRTDEAPQLWVVVAGVVVHQRKAPLGPLTGKGEVGDQGAGDPALLAVGQVAGFGYQGAGDIGC